MVGGSTRAEGTAVSRSGGDARSSRLRKLRGEDDVVWMRRREARPGAAGQNKENLFLS